MKIPIIGLLAIASIYSSGVHGEEVKYGIYSNINISNEGDISGFEIYIVNSRSGDYATVQCAAGEPSEPFSQKIRISNGLFVVAVPKTHIDLCGTTEISWTQVAGKIQLKGRLSKIQLIKSNGFWNQ